MKLPWPFGGESWRGPDGEPEMSEEDWAKRGFEQAQSMQNACDAFESSPDEDGDATGGYYEGDYPQSYQDALNARLDDDEYFEAQTEQDLRALLRADTDRRADEDPL